jgi:hypothetical protein
MSSNININHVIAQANRRLDSEDSGNMHWALLACDGWSIFNDLMMTDSNSSPSDDDDDETYSTLITKVLGIMR